MHATSGQVQLRANKAAGFVVTHTKTDKRAILPALAAPSCKPMTAIMKDPGCQILPTLHEL